MPSTSRCCRSCPRCNDCPVVLAAAARARLRETQADAVNSLFGEVLTGTVGIARRPLPDHIERMLDELESARRGESPAAVAA
ncbi:MAG TPA: hypothetical protein VFG42_02090 [Baekduia sp.]|uniref:hypothetical protein n=1 Tax=Baekduia sp. TaxID=2600305 RepID=UPI002D785FD0|nr:hypothetical protein [Baekduia sp.]HET6505556.1 hypothetical protein [Baekduia sp.]